MAKPLPDSLTLACFIQPGASKSEWVGLQGEAIKARIAAPPEKGKANKELIKLIAKTFDVAKSQVELVSGATQRRKTIVIHKPSTIPDTFKVWLQAIR